MDSGDGLGAAAQDDLHVVRPATPTLFGRLGGLGEAVVELIVDRDLRRQAIAEALI